MLHDDEAVAIAAAGLAVNLASAALLDAVPDLALERAIRERLEASHDRTADLH